LSIGEPDKAVADASMELVFDPIFLVETRRRTCRLRPEIGNVVGAAELKADKVVDFVLPGGMASDPIFGIDGVLFGRRDIAD
jgi:hypothetical protein